ncbi:hypothetical protein BDR06DRAFT_1043599 [Suillus hirtellus]|nr:hypothetical protein BDR06DRAFT_1043599 [Suillus hirtellus]
MTMMAGESTDSMLGVPGKSVVAQMCSTTRDRLVHSSQMVEAFSKLFFQSTIKPTLDVAFEKAKAKAQVKAAAENIDIKMPHKIRVIRRQTKLLYNLALDKIKQQVVEFVEEIKKKKKQELEETKGVMVIDQSGTSEFEQNARTHLKSAVLMGGQIDVQSFHIGTMEIGNQFDQAYPKFNLGIMKPWKEFAKYFVVVAAAKGRASMWGTSSRQQTLEPESSLLANSMLHDISTVGTPTPSLLDIQDDDEDLMLDHLISTHLNSCAVSQPTSLLLSPLLPSQPLPSTSTSTSTSLMNIDPLDDSYLSSPEFLEGFKKFLESSDFNIPKLPPMSSFQFATPEIYPPAEMQMQQLPPTVDSTETTGHDDPTITIPQLQHTTSAEETLINSLANLTVFLTGHSSDNQNTDPISQTDHDGRLWQK